MNIWLALVIIGVTWLLVGFWLALDVGPILRDSTIDMGDQNDTDLDR